MHQARRILGTADRAAEAVSSARRPPPVSGLESLPPGLESMPIGLEPAAPAGSLVARAVAEEREQRIDDGLKAMEKIERGRDDQLSQREQQGLEAIILLAGRPAILIQEGDFMDPPAIWTALKDVRTQIKSVIQRVGRIEVANNPNLDWLGTGFLAGPATVLTNRHVAVEFAMTTARTPGTWTFRPPMTANIDFKEEFGGTSPLEFAITDIIGIHDTLDLAALRVAPMSNQIALPDPIPVVATSPASLVGRKVYVVGYPAWDGRRNDPEPMRRIFSEIYNVKRLQPGEIASEAVAGLEIFHDCSTLGGNSGSPVIDLETHQVLGLHFGGRYMQKNHAIPLWAIRTDPLIQRAGLNYATA